MNAVNAHSTPAAAYRLCFASRADGGCMFAFPCDADGHVDLDGMSERCRNDYFFARAVVGHVLGRPAVHRVA